MTVHREEEQEEQEEQEQEQEQEEEEGEEEEEEDSSFRIVDSRSYLVILTSSGRSARRPLRLDL